MVNYGLTMKKVEWVMLFSVDLLKKCPLLYQWRLKTGSIFVRFLLVLALKGDFITKTIRLIDFNGFLTALLTSFLIPAIYTCPNMLL